VALPSAHSEHEWILIGIAECCATKGYDATTVEDVCTTAGVSRQAFERAFTDKSECLGMAMELVVEEAWQALADVASPRKPWSVALRDGVAALLRVLAERPAFAHVALVEAPVSGGRAEVLAESSRAALLDFLERGRDPAKAGIPDSAARGALAGAEGLMVREVLAGRASQLPAQAPSIVYMLAAPFLGVGESGRLASGAAQRGHLRAVA
jgi:AcrR family transcriptional regulator